jgi:4-hydroxy-L-threonine phosphate dehydrogenase PdxA
LKKTSNDSLKIGSNLKNKMPTSKSTKFKKIAITTGDVDGIGLETAGKALSRLGPQKNCCFFLFRSLTVEKKQSRYLKMIDKKFGRFTFYSIESALGFYNMLEKTKIVRF